MYQAKQIGDRLRALRCAGRYSRKDIAARIGLTAKYYADIERGTCGMSVDTLLALANVYGVSLDYLVRGKENALSDEQVEWAVHCLCGLGEERREIAYDMLKVLEKR